MYVEWVKFWAIASIALFITILVFSMVWTAVEELYEVHPALGVAGLFFSLGTTLGIVAIYCNVA